jgi:alkylation response protein AidB-like acyl-CoA dehydrogenase
MDVRLSPEQRALRDSAVQVVDRLAPAAVRDLDDAERMAKLDAAVEASGWRELRAASSPGRGPLASAVEAAIVAEELGRGPADVAFLGPTLAAELRRLADAPPSASRETVALVPDLSAPAGATGGGLGPGAVAIDARDSSAALVLVPVAGGHALAQLALPVAPGSAGGLDLTRPGVWAEQGATPVGVAGERTLGPKDLQAWTALGLALACADLVGTMAGAIRLACDYAGARRQFGAAVGSFQAVQHMLADAYVALEGSRSVALYAAWAVDALPAGEALAAASVAKAYCSRAARSVCEAAIQVHGGIGNTWDCVAHVYLRRALLSIDLLGGVGPSLARVLEHHGIGGPDGLR